MVWVPVLAPAFTVIFIVDAPEPGAAILVGAKLTLTPAGRPDADRTIAELKLPVTTVVIVEVLERPQATVSAPGEAFIEKSALAEALTVKAKVAVADATPLPLAVMVIVWPLTSAALLAAVRLMLPVLPVPGCVKAAVTPLGRVLVESVTLPV